MSIADELQKLETLRTNGSINEEEFARAKAQILNGTPAVSPFAGGTLSRTGEANVLQGFARSSRDYWLGGVCGGLGASTPVPSWCWRAGFCFLLLSFGIGIIPYLLLWIFVPLDENVS